MKTKYLGLSVTTCKMPGNTSPLNSVKVKVVLIDDSTWPLLTLPPLKNTLFTLDTDKYQLKIFFFSVKPKEMYFLYFL